MNYYELSPRYDSRKSFYGKAHIFDYPTCQQLFSYETHVATWNKQKHQLSVLGVHSNTTRRHIREFARQNGIELKKVEVGKYTA